MTLPESLPTKWVIIGTILGLIIIWWVTTIIVLLENWEHHEGRWNHRGERWYSQHDKSSRDDWWWDDEENEDNESIKNMDEKDENIIQEPKIIQTWATSPNWSGNIIPSISSGSTNSGSNGV